MREKNYVTCTLKKIVKENTRFFFHTYRDPSAPHYQRDRHIFTLHGRQECSPGVECSEHSIDVRGRVGNGHTDAKETRTSSLRGPYQAYTDTFEPLKGFWSLMGATDRFRSAIESVPEDAEVSFEVLLDTGTHDLLVEHNLHVDYLIMKAKYTRGTREYHREFLIDTYTGRHDTARFGSPGSKFY